MKITIDRKACIGAGRCLVTAPAVFDQSETDGLVVLVKATPDPADEVRVRAAANACPARAIHVEE
jgi:ferredoxin